MANRGPSLGQLVAPICGLPAPLDGPNNSFTPLVLNPSSAPARIGRVRRRSAVGKVKIARSWIGTKVARIRIHFHARSVWPQGISRWGNGLYGRKNV
jgi:hypothetical protein